MRVRSLEMPRSTARISHASVHDGTVRHTITHAVLQRLWDEWGAGQGAVFLSLLRVCTVCMTWLLRCVILDAMHEVFPSGNACLVVVVNGAHATGTGVIWALKPPSSLATSLTFVFHAAPGPSPASSLFSFIFR